MLRNKAPMGLWEELKGRGKPRSKMIIRIISEAKAQYPFSPIYSPTTPYHQIIYL